MSEQEQKYRKLLSTIQNDANKSEIDAMNAYFEHGMDKHCYQEDFYKVWVNERVELLELRLKEAEEVIAFYAHWSSWKSDPFGKGNYYHEISADCHPLDGRGPQIYYGGKRAREYKKKWEIV